MNLASAKPPEQSLSLEGSSAGWQELSGREPAPEDAVLLTDLVEQLPGPFHPRQQEMLSLRMQGHGLDEIALRVRSSSRTVAWVMAEARTWLDNQFNSGGCDARR